MGCGGEKWWGVFYGVEKNDGVHVFAVLGCLLKVWVEKRSRGKLRREIGAPLGVVSWGR